MTMRPLSRYLPKPGHITLPTMLTPLPSAAPPREAAAVSPAPLGVSTIAGRPVEGKALDVFARSANELRDHALFAGVEPKDIKRLRVRAGGQTAVLERSGESEWKLVEPTKGPAKAPRVEDLLFAIRALRWTDIVSPRGEDAAKFGLEAPSMEVVLLKGDGGELARLTVVKRDGDRAYVRAGTGPAIYAIDARTLVERAQDP